MMSWFADVETPSAIEVFELHRRYYKDPFDQKINLAIGAYRTNENKPWVLPAVRIAEKCLAEDETLDKEYLHPLGLDEFCNISTKLLLGNACSALKQNRAFGVQSLSGAGALRIGAEYLVKVLGQRIFYYSNPTWGNHKLLFQNAGFTDGRSYRYWSESNKNFDIQGMLEDLQNAPEESVIILQSSAHNPTGCDPTLEQWAQIAQVMKMKRHFPFFDSALQGFATGDMDQDAASVRLFVEQGFELFCAQSYSKNMGLYNDRIGNLVVVLAKPELLDTVKAGMTSIVRRMYNSPPCHGARIVCNILSNPELYNIWLENVKTMFYRLKEMRARLRQALEDLETPGKWSHLTEQSGMSCCTGLNKTQAEHMVMAHHMYILSSGRINIAAIIPSNVDVVAQAIHQTVLTVPSFHS